MPFGMQLLQAPTGEPVSLAEARAHCRIDDDDTTQDGLLLSWARAARRLAENVTGRQLVSASWQMTIDRFPGLWCNSWGGWGWGASPGWGWANSGGLGPAQGAGQYGWKWWLDQQTIRLPKPPLQAVAGVQYWDMTPSLQTLASSAYLVDPTQLVGTITPTFGTAWPVTNPQPSAVTIQFTAGHGSFTAVPAAIAAGTQTVTPASMFGITVGTELLIDTGKLQERLVVSSATTTTFTAVFVNAHAAGAAVAPGLPDEVKAAMLLLIGHCYEDRKAVSEISMSQVPLGVLAMLYSAWDGRVEGDGLSY